MYKDVILGHQQSKGVEIELLKEQSFVDFCYGLFCFFCIYFCSNF